MAQRDLRRRTDQIAFSNMVDMSADTLAECEIALGRSFVADIAVSVTRAAGAYRYCIDALVVDAD